MAAVKEYFSALLNHVNPFLENLRTGNVDDVVSFRTMCFSSGQKDDVMRRLKAFVFSTMRGDNRASPNEDNKLPNIYLPREQTVVTPRLSNVEHNFQENDLTENKLGAGQRSGSNFKTESYLSFPKITNNNRTVSGKTENENDPPGKWFLTDEDGAPSPRSEGVSEEQKKILESTDPEVQSSPQFYKTLQEVNFVSENYLLGLLQDKDEYIKKLRKGHADSCKRERSLIRIANEWKSVADDSRIKLNDLHKKRKVEKMYILAGRKTLERDEEQEIEDTVINEEELDVWQKRAKEYKAKLKAVRAELKAAKESLVRNEEDRENEKDKKEAELDKWQNKAFEYQKKYRVLFKELETLKISKERDKQCDSQFQNLQ